MPHAADGHPLLDGHGRRHNYLRISLTERCNLRCTYCMPEEGVPLQHKGTYMTGDEVVGLARVFVGLGVDKIRLTGGEPLVRKDFPEIARGLAAMPVSMNVTTNGVLVDRYVDLLEETGFRAVNVSLDTLHRERFFHLAKRDELDRVKANIDLLVGRGFKVKVNVVLLKNFNDDEIADFIAWSAEETVHVRFIEFMPFDGNHWAFHRVFPYREWLEAVRARYDLEKLEDGPHDTARAYRVKGGAGTFGMIASVTAPFCRGCNRIRLTADGKIRNCLFSDEEIDLLRPFRRGEDVEPLIRGNIGAKHARHGGIAEISRLADGEVTRRSMIRIGG